MISSVGVGAAYSGLSAPKNETKKSEQTTQTQSSNNDSKVVTIAKEINDGTYKVDIDKLAKKIADSLM
ncbi:flagellar biosynthesis anti-sigma factor FlgM [Campylobacter fetus]|nr:flagellar biosynthesis anti-sigma factor FlgM [Campylobacter fetus]EJU9540596.1 flagellar biosynthesis anti-sigma factor FlgM [Campylobacter fetus]